MKATDYTFIRSHKEKKEQQKSILRQQIVFAFALSTEDSSPNLISRCAGEIYLGAGGFIVELVYSQDL